jgi:hypothetical protein
MKTVSLALAAIVLAAVTLVVLPITVRAASGHDFDAVVSAVEHRYDARAEKVPMMGFVNFCAWAATRGGVKGMKIAEFDHLDNVSDSAELEKLVDDSLGGAWQRFIVDRSRTGEVDLIYVQPSGSSMRMLITDYEHGELDVVRVEVNADRLKHWMRDPEGSAKRHDYGADEKGVPD